MKKTILELLKYLGFTALLISIGLFAINVFNLHKGYPDMNDPQIIGEEIVYTGEYHSFKKEFGHIIIEIQEFLENPRMGDPHIYQEHPSFRVYR